MRIQISNKLLSIAIVLFCGMSINSLTAQQFKIGTNIVNIKSSALLELEDSNKALLLTRVFNPNTSIKNPWKGMIVFDSTINQLGYYNGTDWVYVGESNNIYNTDGIIENTTLNKRTISRKDNLILFVDTTVAIVAPMFGDKQMKTYDTITFGKYGRVGIGTTNPQGKLDVRGPVYIYADATNNAGFFETRFGASANPLPALVIQPDTVVPPTNLNLRTIFISLFNRKYTGLYTGFVSNGETNPPFSSPSSNVMFKEGRTDIGFLGNGITDSNLFTIWNRSTVAGGIALRAGDAGIFRINNGGQIGIGTNTFTADTALFVIDARVVSNNYKDSIRNRYPLLINGLTNTAKESTTGGTRFSNNSKLGILFTSTETGTITNNVVNSASAKLGYLWALNPLTPIMGISTYFNNGNNNAVLPQSDLYEVIRFYIDQSDILTTNNTMGGVTTVKIINVGDQRYSRLAFSERDLKSKWQFMKIGTNNTSSIPSFVGQTPNDFYLVKDSINPWIKFAYAEDKIYFTQPIDATGTLTPSDRRIKRIKDTLKTQTALEKIKAINIVDYTMKKDTAKEKTISRGVVAQEVEKILPEAVNTSKTIHPLSGSNIEEYVQSIRVDSSNKKQWYIEVILPDHGLKKGDKLYLKLFNILGDFAPNSLQENVVGIVNKDCFKLEYSEELANAKKLYIIGQEIKDLKTVDYNYLNMTNIAATQELSKELDEANKKIKALEEDVFELKEIIKKLSNNSSK